MVKINKGVYQAGTNLEVGTYLCKNEGKNAVYFEVIIRDPSGCGSPFSEEFCLMKNEEATIHLEFGDKFVSCGECFIAKIEDAIKI